MTVALMCFDVLREYQSQQIRSLQSQGATKPDTFLVAVINNSQQCSENSEEMKNHCKQYLESDLEGTDMEDKLMDKTEDIVTGFAQVGAAAIKVLAEQMVQCIKEKVLPEMFTAPWLAARDGEYGERIIATFSDYFGDYESWIANDFFFSKLIQDSMQAFVRGYCDSFLACNMNAKKKDFLAKIHADYELLYEWYTGNNISDYIPTKVAEVQISHIEKIQNILDCESGWVPLFFESVFAVFGADRGAALKTLLNMRSDMSSSEINQLCEKFREKYSGSSGSIVTDTTIIGDQKKSGLSMWGFHRSSE